MSEIPAEHRTAAALARLPMRLRSFASLSDTRLRAVISYDSAALVFVTALSSFLHLYRLDVIGLGNLYYAAAVKSMLGSWHNFFFVSFDPGGFVAVDKPPLGLWVQTASAWLFGFSGFSLLLPQALAGVLAVVLLFHLVKRAFGLPAGFIASVILALTPINVAGDRNNTMDAQLVLVSLLAAWTVLRAVESGHARWLLLSVSFVGLGFNIKMLQAIMILPAIYATYLVAAPVPVVRRIAYLCLATVVLAGVSLAWALAVDLTPADQRPYVGSSRDNTVRELILGHNGIERLGALGRLIGLEPRRPGPPPASSPAAGPPPLVPGGQPNQQPGQPLQPGAGQRPAVQPQPPTQPAPAPGQPAGGPGGPAGETGQPGLLRLFNRQLAGQASWLLPLAAFGLMLALPLCRLRGSAPREFHAVLLWAGWLTPQLVFFSFAGLFHRYYLEMMSPAIAAGAAIAIVLLWREYRRGGPAALLLPIVLTASALVEMVIVSDFPSWSSWLTPLILGLVLGPALVLAALGLGPRRLLPLAQPALAVALFGLLIAPAAWSVVTVWRGGDSGLPFAGPDLTARRAPGRLPINSPLLEYLTRSQGEEKFLVATVNTNTAAPIILATGLPVMALGGFSGGDPILSMEQLSSLVAEREVRFFYLPQPAANAQRPPNQQMNLVSWVERTCRPVTLPVPRPGPLPPGPGTPGMAETNRLFDCRR